ncbi:MAG TPA: DNA alkylation repair protein [Actinopolymorphaceae bacterium]|jgi:3-methyladenine DNA glycosylase AlkD
MTGSTSVATPDVVLAARAALAERADPVRAVAMRAYMKSAMPYRGVASPGVKAVVAALVAEHPFTARGSWLDAALRLWREAEFREERYVGLGILAHRHYARWRDSSMLAVYEELITTGAWWDFVDVIASHHVGPILLAERTTVTPIVRRWSTSPDMWLRRSSILCQLGAKDAVDLELLTEAIEANASEREFFIRKAIGWALRQHAWRDPAWVRAFVDDHPQLSGLSRREATKHL